MNARLIEYKGGIILLASMQSLRLLGAPESRNPHLAGGLEEEKDERRRKGLSQIINS